MPRLMAMGTIVTRCQQRADLVNDDHISTAEWKALVSEAYGEQFGIVCGAGSRYFETVATFTATGAASYPEPDDHLSTISVYESFADGSERQLRELMPSEVHCFAGHTGPAVGFTLVDDAVQFYPRPSSGTYAMRYMPQSPDLSAVDDAELIDVVTPDGEAFLIWSVCVLAKSKSESDVRLAAERQEAARVRLLEWCVNRSMSEPRRRPAPNWAGEFGGLDRWGNPL